MLAVFAGAFRSWHGAVNLALAIKELEKRGRSDVGALFIGDGPELPRVRTEAAGSNNVIFTGAVPHDRMPACLAAADIGVAPFDLSAHKPLALGFYWSPLKIFEYMAAGLPIVAPLPTGSRGSWKEASKGCSISPRRRLRAWPMRWSD